MNSLNLPYNPRIDQLRWLAATLVFVFHFYLESRGLGAPGIDNAWFGLISEGHTGVGLFFTLSGFLFMQIAMHQGQLQYGDFVRNRCLRILPLFLTIFLLATSIGRDKFQPQDIFYVLTTNLGLAPTSGTVITGAAWCISLEFLFYMIFPFLARFAMEQGMRYLLQLLGLMLFFKLAAYTVNEKSQLMYFSTFVGRFDQFLIGMLAAQFYQRHAALLTRLGRWIWPASALLVLLNSAAQAHWAPFGAAPKPVFWIFWSMLESGGWACFILAWMARPAMPWAGALARLIGHGGKVSFSFYLLHMALIHVLGQAFGLVSLLPSVWLNTALLAALTYALTWALATLSYHTIEAPFLRMRRAYGGMTR